MNNHLQPAIPCAPSRVRMPRAIKVPNAFPSCEPENKMAVRRANSFLVYQQDSRNTAPGILIFSQRWTVRLSENLPGKKAASKTPIRIRTPMSEPKLLHNATQAETTPHPAMQILM